MRTAIGNCKNLSVQIGGDEDGEAVYLNWHEIAACDIVALKYGYPFLL